MSPLNVPPIEIPEFFDALMGETKRTVTSDTVHVYDYNHCLTILMTTRRLSLGLAEQAMKEEYLEKYFDQQSPIFFKLIEA